MKNFKVRTIRPPVSRGTCQALELVLNYLQKQDGVVVEQVLCLEDYYFTLLISQNGSYDIDEDKELPGVMMKDI